MVFDNLVLNLKSMIVQNRYNDDICDDSNNRIDDHGTMPTYAVSRKAFTTNLLTNFRAYFNGRYSAVNKTDNNDDDLMFPRVYSCESREYGNEWDPVVLKASEKVVDELDNVVEKFMRVINVEVDSSSATMRRDFHVRAIISFLYLIKEFSLLGLKRAYPSDL